jgi:hypothetical protein
MQHTFTAPTRRAVAVTSIKIADTIISAPIVFTGTYIERKVILALTCDYNAFQKNPNCKLEDDFLFT